MKKRTESNLVTACLEWLQCMENLRKIAWCDRNNSGAVYTGKYRVRLHRPGTPDIFIYANDGAVIHIECKDDGEVQSGKQVEFENMVSRFSNHQYFVVFNLQQLVNFLNSIGIKA